jgi:long-chain acyl-CoA synthetase
VSFYEIARQDPAREAVIDPDGTAWTFGRLGERVNRLSRAFRALGLGRGDAVAAALRNGHEFLELLLAAGQSGMYLVPVNPRLTRAEAQYILSDSGARLVVAAAELAAGLPLDDSAPEHRFTVGGPVPGWRPYDGLGAGERADPPQGRSFGMTMGYTSGTTGRPKGVAVPLFDVDPELVIPFLLERTVTPYVEDRPGTHLVCSPLYHAAPNAHASSFLHAGHRIVIHEKFDPGLVLRDIERYRVTTSHMVPTHFHRLLALPPEVRKAQDVSSLEAVIHAGAPCPVAIKQAMLDWLGPIVWEYFASSEGYLTRVGPREWLERPGTVGRAVPGVTLRILGEDGQETGPGEAGLIYFTTEGVGTFEYHNAPEKTAASRRGDLGTVGDYGQLDADGYLFPLDRRDDLIISGGVNVYPAEVEERLLAHPAVEDAAVIGIPHPDWGRAVVAVVQPVPGSAPDEILAGRLLDHCREGLAPQKRPRLIEFAAELPRTETGKLKRRVLRDSYSVTPDTRDGEASGPARR